MNELCLFGLAWLLKDLDKIQSNHLMVFSVDFSLVDQLELNEIACFICFYYLSLSFYDDFLFD